MKYLWTPVWVNFILTQEVSHPPVFRLEMLPTPFLLEQKSFSETCKNDPKIPNQLYTHVCHCTESGLHLLYFKQIFEIQNR